MTSHRFNSQQSYLSRQSNQPHIEIIEYDDIRASFQITYSGNLINVRESEGNLIFNLRIVNNSIWSEGLSLRSGRYSGTQYMELYLEFCDRHNVSTIILHDNSQVLVNHREVSLRILRMFQGQGSWYENFGFTYYNVERMRAIEFSIRETNIEILELEEYETPEFISTIKLLQIKTLGQFMSWLLLYDTRRYVEVIDWLLESDNPIHDEFSYWLKNNQMRLQR